MDLYYMQNGNTVWQSISDLGIPRYGDFVEAEGREYRVASVKWVLNGERRIEVEVSPWDPRFAGLLHNGPGAELEDADGPLGR